MTLRWWTRLVLEVAVVFALLVVAKVAQDHNPALAAVCAFAAGCILGGRVR